VPYNTPACRFQHQALALQLESLGQPASLAPKNFISDRFNFESVHSNTNFQSFEELAQEVLGACGGDEILARGALDEFLRNCPVASFFDNFTLPKNFYEVVESVAAKASSNLMNHSGVIVADGAYLVNRALISAALSSGKPAFVFNPDGEWLELGNGANENFRGIDRKIIPTNPDSTWTLTRQADRYLKQRFSGHGTDLDSGGAFRSQLKEIQNEPKKVLFLHIIRDANQIPLKSEATGFSLFSSFFEWADFCLGAISHDQANWNIKLHPSQAFYEGESEIIRRLFAKHGIAEELVSSCPPTSYILQNGWPVYTHSGTIGFETAVHGYRSHACSTRYPAGSVHLAKSKEELLQHLTKPVDLFEAGLAPQEVLFAGVLLFLDFKRPYTDLGPARPQPDRRSAWTFFWSLFSQGLSLMVRYARPRTRLRLLEVANQLLSNLANRGA
jgi:hypothetical protein